MRRLAVILFSLLLVAMNVSLYAAPDKKEKKKKGKDEIVMPKYPGGQEQMLEYLLVETIYPEEAYLNDEVGEVLVGFRVEKDGFVTSVRVLKGVSPSLDAEAMRVVKKMPRWEPGTKNGIPVPAELSIPINFKLVKKPNYYGKDNKENGVEKAKAREKRRRGKWWSGE